MQSTAARRGCYRRRILNSQQFREEHCRAMDRNNYADRTERGCNMLTDEMSRRCSDNSRWQGRGVKGNRVRRDRD